MIFRSLVASTILAGHIVAGSAEAQVLLCPEAPPASVAADDISAEAERLLKRLIVALDLHGHRGISEQDIMQAHAETPSAFLAKLTNVVNHCERASGDLERFYAALPDLRKSFLEATNLAATIDPTDDAEGGKKINVAAQESTEAERLEQSINLSVRELWRKLWFRPAEGLAQSDNRWAVIVASPSDADSGWDALGEHQRRWIDAYFQLHEPYYDNNPHHAIVVGRRLPEEQADRLRDYVIELGMAEDAYLWALPGDNGGAAGAEVEIEATTEAKPDDGDRDPSPRDELDLSVLDRQ